MGRRRSTHACGWPVVVTAITGDSSDMVFVQEPRYPQNDKERLGIVKRMTAHANFALSGDTTLSAIQTAVREIVKKEAGTCGWTQRVGQGVGHRQGGRESDKGRGVRHWTRSDSSNASVPRHPRRVHNAFLTCSFRLHTASCRDRAPFVQTSTL